MGGLSARDPKTRRKDFRSGGGGGYWDHMGPGPSRGLRDDLVDTQIVEQLRQRTCSDSHRSHPVPVRHSSLLICNLQNSVIPSTRGTSSMPQSETSLYLLSM